MAKMLWLDMETTGLDPTRHQILEVACIITDEKLARLESASWVVRPTGDWLGNISDTAKSMHERNGLLEAAPKSMDPIAIVEDKIVAWLKEKGLEKDIVLCGNTIGFDRSFVRAFMPKLEAMLHYRMLDVSSLKVLFDMMYDKKYPKRELIHRAMDDIHESVLELEYYLRAVDAKKLS